MNGIKYYIAIIIQSKYYFFFRILTRFVNFDVPVFALGSLEAAADKTFKLGGPKLVAR